MIIEIKTITEAQAIAIEDMLATWTSLSASGYSGWTSFYVNGDGSFQPRTKVDGHVAGLATRYLTLKERQEKICPNGEYRMDFRIIEEKLKNKS